MLEGRCHVTNDPLHHGGIRAGDTRTLFRSHRAAIGPTMKRPDRRVRAVSSRMSLLAVGERECGRKEEELCEIWLEVGCPARASWAAAPGGVGLEKASSFGGPLDHTNVALYMQ